MKVSQSLIATAMVALLPLAAIAGDKDKTTAPMGTATSAQFDTLDTNRDGRLTPSSLMESSDQPRRLMLDFPNVAAAASPDAQKPSASSHEMALKVNPS